MHQWIVTGNRRHDALAAFEAEVRRYEAQLHEITTTVAGVASAVEVLPLLPPEKRGHFEAMMSTELRRLLRVIAGSPDPVLQAVAIDDVVAPLVAAHRARGSAIIRNVADVSALSNADVLSEALNVLLDNAAQHGDPGSIRIETRRRGDRVEVLVSDRGPGIDATVYDHLFEWGNRRPHSTGRGIGLAIARERLREWGGDLRLEGQAPTVFAIDLPVAGPSIDMRAATPELRTSLTR